MIMATLNFCNPPAKVWISVKGEGVRAQEGFKEGIKDRGKEGIKGVRRELAKEGANE